MSDQLISREALKKEVKTLFCPDGYKIMMLERIDNAPTVEPKQGECEKCDYYNFSQAFINGIVEVISKNGITTIDELLETLKGGAE